MNKKYFTKTKIIYATTQYWVVNSIFTVCHLLVTLGRNNLTFVNSHIYSYVANFTFFLFFFTFIFLSFMLDFFLSLSWFLLFYLLSLFSLFLMYFRFKGPLCVRVKYVFCSVLFSKSGFEPSWFTCGPGKMAFIVKFSVQIGCVIVRLIW